MTFANHHLAIAALCALATLATMTGTTSTANASGKAKLLPLAEIDRVAVKRSADIKRCYIKHALGQKTAAGKVKLKLVVGARGRVHAKGVKVSAPGVKGKKLVRCVAESVRRWRFAPSANETTVVLPFTFLHTRAPGAGPMKR